jgi:DNA helicase-2/ATP-dependent DNA helicase PcrA
MNKGLRDRRKINMIKLSPEQAAAAENKKGLTTIVATAGAGKTTTIALRIANLLRDLGIEKESEVLATTFTRAAAGELQERIDRNLGKKGKNQRGTLHSFAHSVLFRMLPATDFKRTPVIMSDGEVEQELKKVACAELGAKNFTEVSTGRGLSYEKILEWKNEYDVRRFSSDERDFNPLLRSGSNSIAQRIYNQYQSRLYSEGLIDFDAILTEFLLLLIRLRKGEIQTELSSRLKSYLPKYLFVDEAQDLSAIQWEIVNELSAYAEMVVVIGDDDQSIYAWRGARPWRFRSFADKSAHVFRLTENRRCAKDIVDLSASIVETISKDKRIEKSLAAQREDIGNVRLFIGANYENLIENIIARSILPAVRSGSQRWKDFAFIYRSKTHSKELIEGLLTKYAVPYSVVGDSDSQDFPEFKFLKYFGAALIPPLADNLKTRDESTSGQRENRVHWENLLLQLGVPADTSVRIMENAAKMDLSIRSIANAIRETRLSPEKKTMLVEGFISDFSAMRRKISSRSLPFREFYEHPFIQNHLNKIREQRTLAILNKKFPGSTLSSKDGLEILERRKNKLNLFLSAFLDESFIDGISKMSLEPPKEDDGGELDTIQVTSAHSSKGLEWDTVYILHFNNNNWPSRMRSKAVKKELGEKELRAYYDGIEEEKRLLYVAMTRAKQNLILTSSLYESPSPFPSDEKEEFLQNAPSLLPAQLERSVSNVFKDFHKSRVNKESSPEIKAFDVGGLSDLYRKK